MMNYTTTHRVNMNDNVYYLAHHHHDALHYYQHLDTGAEALGDVMCLFI